MTHFPDRYHPMHICQPRLLFWLCFVSLMLSIIGQAHAQAVISDSRIKTLVYNPNEVYRIVTNYGFQSNIEFAKNEKIQTISIGDQTMWQIIPSERHLFIRALAENGYTNMTVITDKHTYQFDLYARSMKAGSPDELAYVVRFYYPDESMDFNSAPPSMPIPSSAPMPQPSRPFNNGQPPAAMGGFNYNYTVSGAATLTPTRVYDDGMRTYFSFADVRTMPEVNLVSSNGAEQKLPTYMHNNQLVINAVSKQFTLRIGRDVACVFNETAQQEQ